MRNLDGRRYRVIGTSQSLPRVLIVADGRGRKLLYFATTGKFSREPLSPGLEAALFDGHHGHQRWKPVVDSDWVDVSELHQVATLGFEWYRRRPVAQAEHG